MQSASTLLLSALIPTHPTTFHITSYWTSYWGAVVLPRFCSSQYLMCGCFFLIIFVSIVGDCLGSKIKVHPPMCHQFAKHLWRYILILMYLFCQAIWMLFFINSLGNSRNFLHYQWPKNLLTEETGKYMTPNSIVWKMNVCVFLFKLLYILQSIVLLLRHCNIKWSPSYLNAKNRYLGMTMVTKRLHKDIAKLN